MPSVLSLSLREQLEANPDDAIAWAELLRLYEPKLRALIYSRGGSRHADDILQQVWMRFYVVLIKRRLNGPFEPLLVTATLNIIKTTLTSEAKHLTTPLDEVVTLRADFGEEAEQTVLRSDLEAFFVNYMNSNSNSEPREAKILRLKAFELRIRRDMKYKEIALELGVPENTISTWIRRLRQQFTVWSATQNSENIFSHGERKG